MITTNTYSKELCHIGIKLGAQRENHKYVARVETKPGKYLYFYDMNRYNSWKNGAKNNLKTAANNFKNKISDKVSGLRGNMSDTLKEGNIKLDTAINRYKKYISDKAQNTKNKVKENIQKEKENIQKEKDAAKVKIQKESDMVKTAAKQKASEMTKKAVSAIKRTSESVKNTREAQSVNKVINNIQDKASKEINNFLNTKTGKEVNKLLNKMGIHTHTHTDSDSAKNVSTINEGPSARIINYSDKYKTGASGDEAVRQAKVQEYRSNEPAFMKVFKKQTVDENGNLPDTETNISLTNPQYTMDPNATINCFHCTTAYDLRKRGYDVYATAVISRFSDQNIGDNGLSTFFDIETKSKTDFGKGNDTELEVQSTLLDLARTSKTIYSPTAVIAQDYQRHISNSKSNSYDDAIRNGTVYCPGGYTDNKGNSVSIVPSNAIARYCDDNNVSVNDAVRSQKVRTEALSNAITEAAENYPNNSWGRVSIKWASGGGHSIAWEKDVDGTVRFIDGQTNKIMDISNYMESASLFDTVDIVRTDNLDMKETVTWFINSEPETGSPRINQQEFEDQTDERGKKQND